MVLQNRVFKRTIYFVITYNMLILMIATLPIGLTFQQHSSLIRC